MAGKTFFVADTHFGHEAMIRFENRPFENTKDMERQLIKNWNETVDSEDRVYVLGDFAFGDKAEVTRLCRSLNGKKILVLGNHDTQSPEWYRECGFEEASPWPIIIEGFWILSHEPLYINAVSYTHLDVYKRQVSTAHTTLLIPEIHRLQ